MYAASSNICVRLSQALAAAEERAAAAAAALLEEEESTAAAKAAGTKKKKKKRKGGAAAATKGQGLISGLEASDASDDTQVRQMNAARQSCRGLAGIRDGLGMVVW
jgi:hypothetical protein